MKTVDILTVDIVKGLAFVIAIFFYITSRFLGISFPVLLMFLFICISSFIQMMFFWKEAIKEGKKNNKNNKNNKKMVRFMVQFIELDLTAIGFFYLYSTSKFNSICFLWLAPLFLRWCLPRIFVFFKKRST